MSKWVNVILAQDLKIGQHTVIFVENHGIAVFNAGGEFYAVEDSCTHLQLPLRNGHLESNIIECPFHGARFCLKTGKVKSPPAFEDLLTFPVRVEAGMIQVEV